MADSTVFENGGDAQENLGKKSRPMATHPKTIDMLMEALRNIDVNPRKGTSVLSVKKWIGANYPDAKLGVHLKNALTKALATGAIERPRDQVEITAVLVGRYKLGKPPKPAAKIRAKKAAEKKTKTAAKGKTAEVHHRGRSTSPKVTGKKPFPRARARSVSATPRVSKSKRVRSRLSKSHSPLRTPKMIKPKTKSVAGKKKTITSPAAKKAAAAKPTKKSAAKPSATDLPEAKTSKKSAKLPVKATKASKKQVKSPVKATKSSKDGKAAGKDAPKKKK